MTGDRVSKNYSHEFVESMNFLDSETLSSSWDIVFRDSTRYCVQYIIMPVVLIVGLIGNIITIFILTRRNMRSSSNMYLTALALADLMFIIFSFSMTWKHYAMMDGVWLYWTYIPIGLWITDASCSTSVWLTVAFTIERYIAVCHPMIKRANCTEKRAKYVSIIVYTACFLLTASTPFEWKSVAKLSAKNDTTIAENATKLLEDLSSYDTVYILQNTDLGESSYYRFFYHWMTIVVFVVIPLCMLSVFNFLLIRAVRKSRAVRESLTPPHLHNRLRLRTMRQEDRITITLIAVVIMFLICQMPTAAVLIYTAMRPPADHESVEENILLALGNIFNLLVAINAACNFLLYTALSDKYRKIFLNIILFKWSLLKQRHHITRPTGNVRYIINRRAPVRIHFQVSQNSLDNQHHESNNNSTDPTSSGNKNGSQHKLKQPCYLQVGKITLSWDGTRCAEVPKKEPIIIRQEAHTF